MNYAGAFAPGGATGNASVTTSAAETSLAGTGNVVRLVNTGTVVVFVATDPVVADATASNFPVLGGTVAYLSIPDTHTRIGYLSASGAATIYFTRGSLG